jgi:hypothetical protein
MTAERSVLPTAASPARAAPTAPADGFLGALHAPGPAPELGDAAGVYGWLVGSWEMRVVDHPPDGPPREAVGEWHFARVLEGRVVQDVFIVPHRPLRGGSALPRNGNRYGSSIRVCDAATGTWKVIWINPVNGVEEHLVGRRVGDEIVQEGRCADGSLLRWSFVDITPDSFTWRGERSTDGGATWILEAEFFGRRVAGAAAGAGG